MLKFSVKPLFAARGIVHPIGYLRKGGFSPYAATSIVNESVKNLSLKQFEKLCLLLNCTPHDLLVWEPSVGEPERFDLFSLVRSKKVVSVVDELRTLPMAKLDEVHRFIEEKKREGE